ncbi:23S rRNA (adenine(2030)-N(6))-methyltransferase RlmJ [Vandammella animalimorsus]|uniref:Ribosomal RNA large subunit methyltransferase J n=1 Tax=Vandammella animalimorsus TaxID=2029117 RepID=A0A2A2T5Q3_9BURK|nr:23S rRNA (adenine(2030)-N(6))-methyltransferase RlmJ [Vandammella animalimorsus]PAT30897.1 23S rRNA (adenine(2030)-N(6))-methyltransferase RlmJ [Vandammella animalimorsus]PAX16772.1 23S rRNA (adenine(2030)-N(6))-methyltransferase RlmJ [Vandammella animalimorsus]PAX20430.1 23S rRNA (adenine(2030)-N(6))-methyltransferase RlmJ [Vandammella animalimorsus]
MFSYRHAFHAGNHADVLKHTVLLAALDHLLQKDTALALLDTHAGNGLYRLDGDFAQTSGESQHGIQKLLWAYQQGEAGEGAADWPEALQRYVQAVLAHNTAAAAAGAGSQRLVYPGSPALLQQHMRAQDQLHVFELQPADMRALQGNLQQGPHAARCHVWHEDGWQGSLRLLPPPSRRALLLCDPSYEMKSDYAQAAQWLGQALRKFATGCYIVWYPVIPRPEAHALPRKLKALAQQAGKPWLHATLAVRSGQGSGLRLPGQQAQRPGMVCSGVLIVNPPYTLQPQLQQALPVLTRLLAQDSHAAYTLESSAR